MSHVNPISLTISTNTSEVAITSFFQDLMSMIILARKFAKMHLIGHFCKHVIFMYGEQESHPLMLWENFPIGKTKNIF